MRAVIAIGLGLGLALLAALALPARAQEDPYRLQQEAKARFDTHTTVVLLTSVALVVGWDIYLAAKGGKTESQLIKDTAWDANTLPFMCGVLLGHWFLLRAPDKDGHGPANSLPGILTAVAAVAVWDLAWGLSGGSRYAPVRHPAIWAGLGIAVGGLVWSQRF